MQLLLVVLLFNVVASTKTITYKNCDCSYILELDDDCEKDAKDNQLEKEIEKDKITDTNKFVQYKVKMDKKQFFINHVKLNAVYLDKDHLPPLF
jgi:hypothetical protein